MRKILSVLVSFFLFVSAFAQVKITGKVYNVATNETMPFVSIIVVGTTTGTVSDIDGNFSLTAPAGADSLRAVYVGYLPSTVAIRKGVSPQVLNIPMKVAGEMDIVDIHPGENPAVTLLKKVYAHKDQNDKRRLDCYQYEVYNKLEFDLNNITPKFQQSKVMKPVKFIFDDIDSTNPSEKPNLPIFFSESISDFYYKKSPECHKEVIKGSQVSGIQDASVSQFTGDMYQDVDIYKNNILVFGKLFVSPISNNGTLFYHFYLIDSTVIDGHWCYQIQFKPKRKQELLFYGNMWIADTAFAVKRIEMNIADDANINYVNSFYVIQEYDNASGAWMMTKERVIGDFNMTNKQMGFYGRKTTSYRDILVNQCKDDDFYTRTDNLIVQPGAESRDSAFWANARHDSLTRTERQIYARVDSVQHLPIYKTWETVAITAYTGYKTLGDFEYGPWYKTVSYNRIEGTRLRVGGRTSNDFSKWVELNGYVAYGCKDEEFKYGAGFKTFITKKPRQLTGVNYKNDFEILGLSNNAFSNDNIMATIFRRTPFTNYTRVEQYEWWYERDIFKGLNMHLSLVNRNMYPLGDGYIHPLSDGGFDTLPRISTSELRLNIRFAFNEKYVEGVFSRTSVGTLWPVFQVQYVSGFKGVFGSQYAYQRLTINCDDRIRINPIGYLNYTFEVGKTWGRVPFPLMILHPGNETYVYDGTAYNMMNYFEFASDQYASAILIHHFDGFFFNKIPLIRKLKWREVLSFRALYGSVSKANRNEILFPSTLYSLDHGPYMELGAGIENIFRFFRVDCFWRLNYLDHPNVAPVGVRIGLQIIF
ncbi:MAG TPA: DUF5686 family protein [Bacteroidia bacterium]|nr:DUF5686 family protein [Bacteroidia bacterium]